MSTISLATRVFAIVTVMALAVGIAPAVTPLQTSRRVDLAAARRARGKGMGRAACAPLVEMSLVR